MQKSDWVALAFYKPVEQLARHLLSTCCVQDTGDTKSLKAYMPALHGHHHFVVKQEKHMAKWDAIRFTMRILLNTN